MKREIVYVNEKGIGPDGDDFALAATQEAIKAGLMINVPVTLVFPDGRRLDTNQAKITPFGFALIKKDFGKGRSGYC